MEKEGTKKQLEKLGGRSHLYSSAPILSSKILALRDEFSKIIYKEFPVRVS